MPIKIITGQFKQTLKLVTGPLVGMLATKLNSKEETSKCNFLTHAYDTKERVAEEEQAQEEDSQSRKEEEEAGCTNVF